jgi:hypothetical protein
VLKLSELLEHEHTSQPPVQGVYADFLGATQRWVKRLDVAPTRLAKVEASAAIVKRSASVVLVVTFAALSACGGGTAPTSQPSNPTPTPAPTYTWYQAATQAPFAGRDGAGLVAFSGKLWLLGGWRWASAPEANFPQTGLPGCCTTSEVWNSTDGVHWMLATVAPWEGRHMAGWVVFLGKLWVIGGDDNSGHYQPNVWNSSDGVNWSQVTSALPWGDRVLHYVVPFNGRLYVMGGQQLPAALNPIPNPYPTEPVNYADVWSSSDGITWQQVSSMPAALGMICGSVVFNNQLWVIGGGTYGDDTQGVAGTAYNEVWSTPDGVTWTQHMDAPWPARRYHNVVEFNSGLFVLAGIGDDGSSDKNDVYYSTDGESWQTLNAPGSAPWVERHAASAAVFNGALWLTGGTDNGQIQHNDVWQLISQE